MPLRLRDILKTQVEDGVEADEIFAKLMYRGSGRAQKRIY